MANPAANVVMGDYGEVVADGTAIAHLTEWNVNPKISESAWGDSESRGFTFRKGARKDGTGSIGGKFNTTQAFYAVVKEGDEPTLALFVTTTLYWYFPCVLITDCKLAVNRDTKEVVGWTADWGASGIFYRPGEAGTTSVTYPTQPS